MVLDPVTSAKITRYRPENPPPVWEEVAPLVRSVVAATVMSVPYDVERLLHITGRLALWAEATGLERDPDAWLRNEVIDATVGLTNLRATTAHPAAKPTVPIPTAERLRPPPAAELPLVCRKPTLTVRPGDLGKIDKFRQDRHHLTPAWQDSYRPTRANIEGLNGRAKSHHINIADPARRLAHGRTAQTVLLALMICSINLHILHSWQQTTSDASSVNDTIATPTESTEQPTTVTGLPPPTGSRTRTNT